MKSDTEQTVLIRDSGVTTDDWTAEFTAPEGRAANGIAGVDLPSDFEPAGLAALLDAPMIRIAFPSFADGRGFTLARRLRLLGYEGRLRAYGGVISDQYAMARRAGFDEVEVPADLAARQPQAEWVARANWRDHDYQSRLRG